MKKHLLLLATLGLIATTTTYAQNTFPASGNVGIGTTNPDARLVIDMGTVNNFAIRDDSIENHKAANDSSGISVNYVGYQGGTSYFRDFNVFNGKYGCIAKFQGATGNVGIGTTSPTDKLHVVGRIQVDSSAADGFIQTKADNSHIRFGRANGTIGNLVGYRPDVSPGNFVFFSYTGDWVFCNGNVGIGTTNPTEKLSVKGRIRAQEVVVDNNNWSDYVFADDYKLQSLTDVEAQIKTSKHLPGVPSAQEVAEKGVSVGDMQAVLLAKIEELTLHQIAQEKRLNSQQAQIVAQQAEIARLTTAGK